MSEFYINLDKDTLTVMQNYGSAINVELISIVDKEEKNFILPVLFENKTERVTPNGFIAPLYEPTAVLYVQQSEIIKIINRELTKDDVFNILTKRYRVKEAVSDGLGMTKVNLTEL